MSQILLLAKPQHVLQELMLRTENALQRPVPTAQLATTSMDLYNVLNATLDSSEPETFVSLQLQTAINITLVQDGVPNAQLDISWEKT